MKPSRAFTLIELLAILGILALVALLLLPAGHGNRASPKTVNCANNLKQMSEAFRVWVLDHGGKFPMQIETNSGGSFEYISAGETYRHFQAISNELASLQYSSSLDAHKAAKLLICPADVRKPAASLGTGFSNLNVSYFVGLDAATNHFQNFLAGDHNLTNGTLSSNRILELHTNSLAGWTHKLHVRKGNIGLVDGSVQQLSTVRLREALGSAGPMNRLAMP